MGRAWRIGEDGTDGPPLRRRGAGDRLGSHSGQPPQVEANLPDRQSKTVAARMTLIAAGRLWCAAVLTVCASFSALAGETGGAASAAASPEVISDFLIQNVCLDTLGKVLEGVGPIDGDRRCVAQRDLAPGEKLSYHKHDHPSPAH